MHTHTCNVRTAKVLCLQSQKNTYRVITCSARAHTHTPQLFNISAVSPKSFKFPSGAYWILSKISIGRLVLCNESHVANSYASAGHLRTVEEREGWMVLHKKPLSSTSSSFSSSLSPSTLSRSSSRQPPLLLWQLFLMLTKLPTDCILFLNCGFLSFAPFGSLCSLLFPLYWF